MTARKGGVELEDGPAAGRYSITRAPFFLRAVVDRHGRCDLLDQLNDEPRPVERVYVYQAIPGNDINRMPGVIICPPPAAQGRYKHRADVDGETLRDTEAWRRWARAEPAPVELQDGITNELRPAAEPIDSTQERERPSGVFLARP